jgi:hypothetical protein
MSGAATPREAATPYRTVRMARRGYVNVKPNPHDCENVRNSNDRRDETRSLRLMPVLRVNFWPRAQPEHCAGSNDPKRASKYLFACINQRAMPIRRQSL